MYVITTSPFCDKTRDPDPIPRICRTYSYSSIGYTSVRDLSHDCRRIVRAPDVTVLPCTEELPLISNLKV